MSKQDKTRDTKHIFIKTTVKIIGTIVLTVSLLLNLFTLVMPVVKYYGTSMSPTLQDGQILIVSKLSEIESGDIIAFYYNNKVLVRRVAAVGNEQIMVDVFGTVLVNGNEIEEPYIENKTYGQCDVDFPFTVPANTYFVLGDNREVAMDSRLEEIGTVAEDRIIGKIVFSIHPLKIVK